jgi:hypothetical protein
MKFFAVILSAFLVAGLANVQAQVSVGGFTVTPVNNGTGSLVSIPIPGGSGLSVTVGQGSAALPLQNINNLSDSTLVQLGDDGWANIPLPFVFPYWGQIFDKSTMYSNGVVQFGRPVPAGGYPSWNNSFCCHGENLNTNTNTNHNYSIMPLWTDLVDYSGQTTYYRGTADSMTYGWYNTSQYGQPNNRNTFELKINSSGAFDVRYGGTFISPTHGVTIGATGDLSRGEFFQYYHGMGFQGPTTGLSWGALGGTGAVDMCIINPLSSPTCAGYQAAYVTQQCTINALFDPSCPGYQTAYRTQQCSVNPLYDSSCPGYASAYHTQQCSLNPLYATDCPGYAAAYLQLQCTANPLYSTTCEGYAAAYKSQQCSINALYATDCPGYAAAFKTQQCTANPLYATDCPGYAEAYFNQQCILDSLYSNKCEGYATAYAIKYLVTGIDSTVVNQSLSDTAATRANDPTNVKVATNTASTTINTDGSVSTGVSATGDTNVDKAIAAKSSTSGNQPAAAVQLTPNTAAAAVAERRQEQKQDDKKAENKPEGGQPSQGGQQGGQQEQKSDQPKTARQELQERRQEAAKAKAVEQGKDLANNMGKAADMEQQKQIQNVVIQAMGFTPGFDAYKVTIPDVAGYKPYSVYGNQRNVDNRRLGYGLFSPTDNLHKEMINSQYK